MFLLENQPYYGSRSQKKQTLEERGDGVRRGPSLITTLAQMEEDARSLGEQLSSRAITGMSALKTSRIQIQLPQNLTFADANILYYDRPDIRSRRSKIFLSVRLPHR